MFEATASPLLGRARVGAARWSALSVVERDAVCTLLLAPVVFTPVTARIGAEFGDLPQRPYDLAGVLLALALWLPLVLRRRWPGICLGLVAGAFAVHELLGCPQTLASWGLYIALYSFGAHGTRADGARLGPVAAVATGLYVLFALGLCGRGSPQRTTDYVLIYLVLVGCWGIGRAVRARRAAETEQRRLGVEAAMAQERARIARELHDVVTHHVTAMVVQADAAQYLLADAPDRVAVGLEAISDSGRHALTDLQDLLGVLKASGGAPADGGATDGGSANGGAAEGGSADAGSAGRRTPALGRLGDLVEQTRAAGQPVRLTESGERRPLATAVELAAYRVVQETLTNALKHAPGHRTDVQVRYGRAEIEVEVTTEGAPAAPAGSAGPAGSAASGSPRSGPLVRGGGHGLLGLRERVGVFGGELLSGTRPDGGFRVHARIPSKEPV
ncbi:sensor histidine kinase [Streptomyces sp. NPDC001083]|uniref:sensor histidine kinase n=1 Tax=Streptomyces sp. NPDC001083 TaxID=3364545 RepID=UPI003673FBE2